MIDMIGRLEILESNENVGKLNEKLWKIKENSRKLGESVEIW